MESNLIITVHHWVRVIALLQTLFYPFKDYCDKDPTYYKKVKDDEWRRGYIQALRDAARSLYRETTSLDGMKTLLEENRKRGVSGTERYKDGYVDGSKSVNAAIETYVDWCTYWTKEGVYPPTVPKEELEVMRLVLCRMANHLQEIKDVDYMVEVDYMNEYWKGYMEALTWAHILSRDIYPVGNESSPKSLLKIIQQKSNENSNNKKGYNDAVQMVCAALTHYLKVYSGKQVPEVSC
jgi:hypothetical protein